MDKTRNPSPNKLSQKPICNSSQNSDTHDNFVLTISEYEEIASRLQDSHKLLSFISDALSSKESIEKLRPLVEKKCDKMTLRLKVVKKQGSQDSLTNTSSVTDIYKIILTDLMNERKGYMVLKHNKKKTFGIKEGEEYLADRVKLVIN